MSPRCTATILLFGVLLGGPGCDRGPRGGRGQVNLALADPSDPAQRHRERVNALAWAAEASLQGGDADRALETYTEAIGLDPQNDLLHLNRGLAWVK